MRIVSLHNRMTSLDSSETDDRPDFGSKNFIGIQADIRALPRINYGAPMCRHSLKPWNDGRTQAVLPFSQSHFANGTEAGWKCRHIGAP